MKAKIYTLLFSSLLCVSALADNEPWQNPQINEINREPMYAHFIPFTNEANALKQRSLRHTLQNCFTIFYTESLVQFV